MVGVAGGELLHVKMIFDMRTNTNGTTVTDTGLSCESHGARKSLCLL